MSYKKTSHRPETMNMGTSENKLKIRLQAERWDVQIG